MIRSFSTLPFLFFLALTAVLTQACKNDPPATTEETTEEQAPPTRERQNPNIPFEVHDLSGKPIQNYRVFESFEEGSSGSVFQFQHGYANVPFETGARYRIQAEGYYPLDFEFTRLDSLKRAIFYLHRQEGQQNEFLVTGLIKKRDMRPFTKVEVSSENARGNSAAEGVYTLSGAQLPEAGAFPLNFRWTDEEGREGRLDMLFRDLRRETLRIDLVLGADIPESEKSYPQY